MTTTCSKQGCEEPSARGYCRPHRNEYMRDWRAARRERLTPFQLKQARTRAYTNVLVARGKITRQPCSECGSEDSLEAHHPDYSDPRRVVWLCRTHHRALHARLGSM